MDEAAAVFVGDEAETSDHGVRRRQALRSDELAGRSGGGVSFARGRSV